MGVLPVESAVWHASHLKVPSKKVLLDSSRALERELSDSSLSQPLVFSISPPTSVRVFATLQRCSMATDSIVCALPASSAQMASYAHTLNAKHLVNSGSSSWTTESTSTSNISHT